MPTLDWIGKDKVVNHHLEVPYRVLERQYSYDETGRHENDNGSENMIIHGDNLSALKSLLPQYEGRIKCIYIDPPYNTGHEGWVYNDNVNDPQIKKWLGEVVGGEEEDLSRHDKWLCMMYPRLKLLQRLLSDDGVIFISIDDYEQTNLHLLCNEIFGSNNFISKLVWQKRKGGGNDSVFIATDHEYIEVYAKNKKSQTKNWRVPYDDSYLKRYKFEDRKGKYYYDTLSRPGLNNPIIYDVRCPDGSVIKDGTWQISEKTFNADLASGEVDFIKNKAGGYTVVRKVRVPDGKVFRSILTDSTNKNAADEMEALFGNKKEFSNPKPQHLIYDLIRLITDSESIILDSFAGSGTTAHAVLNLNKKDDGNRKFILVELDDYADSITAKRVKRVISGYPHKEEVILYDEKISIADLKKGPQIYEEAKAISKEEKENYDTVSNPKINEEGHLQVIGKSKVSQNRPGTGGNFSYYELGEPILIDDNLNESVGIDKIREYVYFTETKCKLEEPKSDEPYYLGTHLSSAYYFYYEHDEITTLNHDFLHSIKTKADGYVMYADLCTLSDKEMEKYNITFKKIPRDITKL